MKFVLDAMLAAARSRFERRHGVESQIAKARLKESLSYMWRGPLLALAGRKYSEFAPRMVKRADGGRSRTNVEEFWTNHTIANISDISSEAKSLAYMESFRERAPLKHELCDLYGAHEGETVLDYGCGPGNDLVGFLTLSKAERIVGADVSARALNIARRRLALHRPAAGRMELIKLSDDHAEIPLADGSVDYVHCLGVIHHVTHPLETLREFHRVLRPGGSARLMAYNADSIYVHLNIAYELQLLAGEYAGLSAEGAFEAMADLGAPVALCRRPQFWVDLGEQAGFQARYLGAYFSPAELAAHRCLVSQALEDERLNQRHREFLRNIVLDTSGYPKIDGLPVGMSAVILLEKAPTR